MDLALAVSALMMGLAGGPHCAAMCGAAFGGIARQGGGTGTIGASRAMLALHLGRLVSYAAAGALVAASVAWLGSLREAAPVLKPLWTMLHVSAVAFGLWLVWQGRAPAWLAGVGRNAHRLTDSKPLRFVSRVPSSARAGAIGACWAAMPCGLLQSALLVAALASGPVQGAGVMAVFALGSAVSLWLAPYLWLRLNRTGGNTARSALAVRLAGVLLIAASTFALVHGLREAIDQALCLPAA
jgi:sulfite exporter TauE/SafE